MANRLKRLRYTKVALVDRGANPGAHVTLFKRDGKCPKCGAPAEPGSVCKACGYKLEGAMADDLKKQVDDLTKQVTDLTKRATDAEAAKKTAEEALAKAIEKKPDPTKPEDILKNASPEVQAIIKAQNERLEKAEKEARETRERLEKSEEKAELESFAKRAGELGRIGIVPTKHAGILRKIAKALTPEENTEFNRLLNGLDTAAKTSDLFKSIGADGGENGTEPLIKLEKMAKERAAKSAGKETYHQAYAAILETDEGKQLYADSQGN